MRLSERQEVRFLIAGAANTIVGYGFYLLLNLAMDYRIAYSISFAAGIVLSFLLNSIYVFRQPLQWAKLAIYPAVYAIQYGVALACVWLFVDILGQPEALAPLPAIAVSLPLTYVATRFILKGRSDAAAKY